MDWIRITCCVLTLAIAPPIFSGDCSQLASQTREIQALIDQGNNEAAVDQGEALAKSNKQCVDAHLTYASAINARLDDVGNLSALFLSRKYRRAIADALEIAPDNIDARTEEIGYLIYAPGIAGGDRKKARARIAELRTLDPASATQMQLDLARADDNTEQIVASLRELVQIDAALPQERSEFVRRLILLGRTREADADLQLWKMDSSSPAWIELEQLYLLGATRVYGEFELDQAEAFLTQFIALKENVEHERLANAAQAHSLLGEAREGQDDRQGAIAAYRKALEHEPNNERALDGIARLQPS